jgi:hypothetical protein
MLKGASGADVLWTPTVLFLDRSCVERRRMEGYLPQEMFFGELYLGLACVSFMRKDWAEAERIWARMTTCRF